MDPVIVICTIITTIAAIVGTVIAALAYRRKMAGHALDLDRSRHSTTTEISGGTVIQAGKVEDIQIGEAAREEKPLQPPTEISYIILREESEMDKVLGSQLFLETPEGKIGRNWDEIKETVYYEEYEFSEMKEGDILIIHGDIGIGKTTYLLFFVADYLKKGGHVIFIDPTYLEDNLKVLRGETGQIIAIDAFERVEGNFKERCSELIDFAKLNGAKIILTMRNHKREEFKNVVAHKHYEVKEVVPKPQPYHIPYIVANYLLFFGVNADELNVEDAHRIIYGNEYEKYSGLREAIEIVNEKSNASPFYIFHTIKELKRKELPFEVSTIKDLPTGVEELLLNTLKTDFLSGGVEDDVFIAILICMSRLRKDVSVRLLDELCDELRNREDVRDGLDTFKNNFMIQTTNYEVLLPIYWREAIEKALKREISDRRLSDSFRRVDRKVDEKIIENVLKRELESSRSDDEYFHLIADSAKQGLLDYAYQKFKENEGFENKEKNYARFAIANEFLMRGNGHVKLKQYENALRDYDKAIELNLKFVNAYINRSIANNKLERYEDAIKDLNKAIGLYPDNADAYNSRGINYARLNKYKGAFLDFKKAIKLNPKDAPPYYNLAILYEKERKYEEAKINYEKALKLKPDFTEAREGLKRVLEDFIVDLIKQGFLDRGYKMFKEIEGLESENRDYARFALAEGFLERGDKYIKLEQYENALRDYDKAIEMNPKFVEAYVNRSIANNKLEKYEDAIQDLNKVIELYPDNSYMYSIRGINYASLEKYKKSFSDYKKAIKLNPENAFSYYRYAVLCKKIGKYKKAIEYLNKVIELDPGNADAYNIRGLIYVNFEKYTEAFCDFNKSLELNSRNVSSYYNLAVLYEKERKYEEAKVNYEKALKLKPDFTEAREGLERVILFKQWLQEDTRKKYMTDGGG